MVSRTITFGCEKCRKQYATYDEASACEVGHIAQKAVDGFRAKLSEILGRKSP